jgi:lipopolysaccharide transport system ATP-binding protein
VKPIIRIENLSKQYRIGRRRAPYGSLRESLVAGMHAPLRLLRRNGKSPDNKIWALRNVGLEVTQGEVVGIIGRNGAGKSTLLKILSRITLPTAGRVDLYGRVGSLLEVGTGFHPELTGRENIYLNGAILGMKRAEIARKFDEIVAFAEIDKFLETPVKRYSSGMSVRLAFAIAAHLEPEILLVDEVLAVGDALFQKKCLGKMDHAAHQGKTVLFVSHQMPAVKSLCSRVIQIHHGELIRDGDPNWVIDRYLRGDGDGLKPERLWGSSEHRPGNEQFRLVAMRVLGADGELLGTYPSSRPIVVEMEFDLASVAGALCVAFDLINRDGNVVFRSAHNDRREQDWPVLKVGRNRLRCVVPPGLLNAGTYFVAPKVGLHSIAWIINGNAELSFQVQMDHSESPFWNTDDPHKFPGVICPCLAWQAAGHIAPQRVSTTPIGLPRSL